VICFEELRGDGDCKLGRRGRSRCTSVGSEIAQGEIDLVADRADHGNGTARDGANNIFDVERRQVGAGSATAPDDHDIDACAYHHRHRGHDLARSIGTLHRAIGDQDRGRKTPLHGTNDVVNCGSGTRGHHPDPAWKSRQCTLPLDREQAFGGKLLLQQRQRERGGTLSRRLEKVRVKLHFSVAVVHAEASAYSQPLPDFGIEAQACGVSTPHHSWQDHIAVAQGEVEMTRGRSRHLSNFTFEPQQSQPVEDATGQTHQLGDGNRMIAGGIWHRHRKRRYLAFRYDATW
jgi:hypothetical protein